MNICFICDEYPPGLHGGIGTMTQVLARALTQAGHRFALWACTRQATAGQTWRRTAG